MNNIDYTLVLAHGWNGLWKSIKANDPNQIVMVDGEEVPTKKELDDYWQVHKDEILIEQELKSITRQRRYAYQNEADPLYFKWQRGDIEKQVWLDKVSEIKERFPKPE